MTYECKCDAMAKCTSIDTWDVIGGPLQNNYPTWSRGQILLEIRGRCILYQQWMMFITSNQVENQIAKANTNIELRS